MLTAQEHLTPITRTTASNNKDGEDDASTDACRAKVALRTSNDERAKIH